MRTEEQTCPHTYIYSYTERPARYLFLRRIRGMQCWSCGIRIDLKGANSPWK